MKENRKKVYVVEVGVLLDKTDKEYDAYALTIGKGVGEKALYDENTLGFETFDEAKKYVDHYVEVGVPSTYGVVWLDEVAFYSEEDFEYFKSNATLPDWDYDFENILYWKEKEDHKALGENKKLKENMQDKVIISDLSYEELDKEAMEMYREVNPDADDLAVEENSWEMFEEVYYEHVYEIYDADDLKAWWLRHGWTHDRGYGGPNQKERIAEGKNWELLYELLTLREADEHFGAPVHREAEVNDLVLFYEDDELNESKNPNAWMTREYQDELDREYEDDEHENSWMTREYQDELDREYEDDAHNGTRRIQDLTFEEVEQLFNEIVFNSVYMADYENTLGINPAEVSNYADGYLDELATDEYGKYIGDKAFEDIQLTAEGFYDYIQSVEA